MIEISLYIIAISFFVAAMLHQGRAVRNIDPSKLKTTRDHYAASSLSLPSRNALNEKGQIHYDKLVKYMVIALVSVAAGLVKQFLG